MPKFALLTGGGDAPGLNGILESVSRTLLRQGASLIGILDGFEGIFDEQNKPISLVIQQYGKLFQNGIADIPVDAPR